MKEEKEKHNKKNFWMTAAKDVLEQISRICHYFHLISTFICLSVA